MARTFNITGNCFAQIHYMADVSHKLAQVRKMVDEGAYFIINRPRQYGKTTTLYTLAETLAKTGAYLVFNIRFESVSDLTFQDETHFCPRFLELLAKSVRREHPLMAASLNKMAAKVTNLDKLSDSIVEFAACVSTRTYIP